MSARIIEPRIVPNVTHDEEWYKWHSSNWGVDLFPDDGGEPEYVGFFRLKSDAEKFRDHLSSNFGGQTYDDERGDCTDGIWDEMYGLFPGWMETGKEYLSAIRGVEGIAVCMSEGDHEAHVILSDEMALNFSERLRELAAEIEEMVG